MDSGGLREKRRRKILDNAESRLERLRGIKKEKEVEVRKTSAHSASIMKSPIPSTTSTATQPHHISLLHTINSPLVEALRLLATVLAAILALNTFLTSVILISITCTSLVVAMTAVAVLLFPPSPQPHNLGWLHTIPSLLSSVSNTAELVSSYSLAVISIVVIMGRDLLLALFFSVLCSLCRDILTDNDQY